MEENSKENRRTRLTLRLCSARTEELAELRIRIEQSSDFLLFSCIVYFVYFTNYFRVCIFVYLLSIKFVRVLIVYFQNIVYSCITINFTISYVKIAHIYPCTCKYSTVYTTYFCYFILPVPVLFIPHFLNASTDTVSTAVGDQNFFRERKGQNPVMKILLITGIICNFIRIQSQTFWIFKT